MGLESWNNTTTNLINFSDKIFAISRKKQNFIKKRWKCLWVGHPMIDLTKKLPLKKDARTNLGLRSDPNILLLMPASRPQELKYILPTFMAAEKLQQKYKFSCLYHLVGKFLMKDSIRPSENIKL